MKSPSSTGGAFRFCDEPARIISTRVCESLFSLGGSHDLSGVYKCQSYRLVKDRLAEKRLQISCCHAIGLYGIACQLWLGVAVGSMKLLTTPGFWKKLMGKYGHTVKFLNNRTR